MYFIHHIIPIIVTSVIFSIILITLMDKILKLDNIYIFSYFPPLCNILKNLSLVVLYTRAQNSFFLKKQFSVTKLPYITNITVLFIE